MCDINNFTGNMTAPDVLREQMDDMLSGNTLKAYQLASPVNRMHTANGHNFEKFDRMVRSSTYNPLLNAKDYSFIKKHENDCEAVFDVLLYDEDPSLPTHGYEFALSRQIVEDNHKSLQTHKLPAESQFWRTDHVLPIESVHLNSKHDEMMKKRQQDLRKLCFADSYDHASVQHSFGVDMTHNLCCRLGEDAKTYANNTGNPIGHAIDNIGSSNWSTCMGSNVCSYYAQKHRDGTKPLFASSPDLFKLSTYIPPNVDCEAYTASQLSMDEHGTPGILTKGNGALCSEKEQKSINENISSRHKHIQKIISDMSVVR